MNNLQNMKKYKSSSETGNDDEHDQNFMYENK